MKKTLLSILLIVCMVLCFTACGDKDNESTSASDFTYDYDLTEYIKLGDCIGIEYEKTDITVTDGCTASIDFVGKIDGIAFQGGTGSQDLVIGSNSFIPGFESGLIGHKLGEDVTLDIEFPDPYDVNPDLAGKPVTFEVKINAIDGATTNEGAWESIVWEKFFDSCEIIKYPEKELNAMIATQNEYYKSYAASYGYTDMNSFYEALGTTKVEFDATVEEYAKGMIAQDMALYALAREQGIEASEEAKADATKLLLATYGVADEEEFEQSFGMKVTDESVQNSINVTALLSEVIEFMMDNAVAF